MEAKLWLCFLLLHVVHEVQSNPPSPPKPKPPNPLWTMTVPTTIPALLGSCVVIPCKFSFPSPRAKKNLNRFRGFWKKGDKIVASSLPKWKLSPDYKKRTQFLGELPTRNCTVLIDGLKKTDVGPFYFRIEMPQYKSFSYTKKPVTINITRIPQAPTMKVENEEDKVTASCSVAHTCPTIQPKIIWTRTGIITLRLKKLTTVMWETRSTLVFVPRPSDFKNPLNCTAQYRGGKTAMASTKLVDTP